MSMKTAEAEDRPGKHSIGQLNGPWALSLKIMLATYPVLFASIIAWGSWVTKELVILGEFRNSGDRFTRSDALEMRREIDAQFAALPPKDWRDKYALMEKQLTDNRDMLIRLQTTLDAMRQDITELKNQRAKP